MKVSDVEREHIIRCKEIAKVSFEWFLKSYLNRNIPNWGEEITPEGMHISPQNYQILQLKALTMRYKSLLELS